MNMCSKLKKRIVFFRFVFVSYSSCFFTFAIKVTKEDGEEESLKKKFMTQNNKTKDI